MIAACMVFMAVIMFSKQLKSVMKIFARGLIGLVCIFGLNFISAPLFGVSVGVNIITGAVVAILGIPGFVSLYVAGYFL
jgi:pro-sigmaK processing inhibitor BofA